MVFNLKIADHVFRVSTITDVTYRLCQRYLTTEPAEYEITVTRESIARERELTKKLVQGRFLDTLTDEQLEETALYRLICEYLAKKSILLIHASAVSVDGQAYLFAAPSGTGKTTHVKLWKAVFKERAVVINDDKPLVYVSKNQILVYGTPWSGKERLDTNICCPLQAICFLSRGQQNRIVAVGKEESLPLLMNQIYRPYDRGSLAQVISNVTVLLNRIPLFKMQCNMEPEAAMTAYQMMNQKRNN